MSSLRMPETSTYSPTSQSYTNPPANTQFIESVTAPKNNGTFSASLVFSGAGRTQIPSSWVTISPGAQKFTTTGSAGDTKTLTVMINVPSGQADGVYTGHFAASVTGGGGPNPGPGTDLTITVDHTPPAAPPRLILAPVMTPESPTRTTLPTRRRILLSAATVEKRTAPWTCSTGPLCWAPPPLTAAATGARRSTSRQGAPQWGIPLTSSRLRSGTLLATLRPHLGRSVLPLIPPRRL